MQKLATSIDLLRFDVLGITRNPSSVQLPGIDIVKGDILAIHKFEHYFEGCYMIIHGAAITHTRKEQDYYKINLEATKNLVEVAKINNIDRFVFISSNTAGMESGAYGLTKLLAEEHIKKKLSNRTILRLSEVFGDNKNEGIEKLIQSVLAKPFVICPTEIPCKFYPIHVNEVIGLLHHRIFNNDYLNKISVINGAEGFTYAQVIELAKSISKRKVRVLFLNRKAMFFIRFLARLSPINFGLVPDQIDRLYTKKHVEVNMGSGMRLETYIKSIVEAKNSAEVNPQE